MKLSLTCAQDNDRPAMARQLWSERAGTTQQLQLIPDPTPSPDTKNIHVDNTPCPTHFNLLYSVKYFFKVFLYPRRK